MSEIDIIFNLCDTYRLTFPKSDTYCQCDTNRYKKCKNKHKFKFNFSNGEELYTCGFWNHKHRAFKKCVDNITVTISKLVYTFDRDLDYITNEYKIISTNANKYNDYDCPLVSNCIPPNTMNNILVHSINHNKTSENNVRKTILSLKKLLQEEEYNLAKYLRIDHEYKNALYHMRLYTKYTHSNKNIVDITDICPICHDNLNPTNSSILYECNHAFHNDCIKKWFQNKELINCPCCRKICDVKKYFIYSRYKPIQ